MDFQQKLRDVELAPYMLAIYKDNDNHDLLRRSLDVWAIRCERIKAAPPTYIPTYLSANPIYYCPNPPMDLVKMYYSGQSASIFLNTRLPKSVELTTWAFKEFLPTLVEMGKNDQLTLRRYDQHTDPNSIFGNGAQYTDYLDDAFERIAFDDEILNVIVSSGLYPYMPLSIDKHLSEEMKLAAVICS